MSGDALSLASFSDLSESLFRPVLKNKMEQTADDFFKQFLTMPNLDHHLANFKELTSMKEKIEFWLKNEFFQLHIHQLIDQMKANEKVEEKNADVANAFRFQGNHLFRDKLYLEAIDFYTKAAIFAPITSSELGIAHANRSACYYYLDCFEQCLEDIEFALQHEYPNPIKLLIRKSRALHLMGRNIEASQLLESSIKTNSTLEKEAKNKIKQLLKSLPKNNEEEKMKLNEKQKPICWEAETQSPTLPAASDAVEIRVDEFKGRKLVANRKIQADEVVLIAEPFASILRSSQQKQKCLPKCETCYRSLNLLRNPSFACRKCTNVLYCSSICEDNAWKKFHDFECGTLRTGMKWCGDDSLAARVVHTNNVPNSIIEFKDWCNPTETQNVMTNNYESLLSLMDHFDDFDSETLLVKILKATFLTALMTQEGNITYDNFTKDDFLALGEILLKHILQIRINGMFVTAQNEEEKKIVLALKANADDIYGELVSDEENVALGLYPELSLLNHSCDPNLYQRNGIKTITQALRDIKAGEELTITYGPIARAVPRAERHQQLQERYFFICQCIACSDDQYETATAFKCPTCQGAVKYNSMDKSNECLNCHKINPLTLDKTYKLRDFGRQSIIEALTESNATKENVEKVVDKLKKGYEILTHILYKDNRELGIIATEIAVCCTKFSRFEEAEKYAKISGEIARKLYGENSYQFAVEMMRLTDLQRMRIETEFPMSALNEEYWRETISTLSDTVELYRKHIGDAKRNKDSYSIRCQQLENLTNQLADLSKKFKDSNSIEYAVNLLKKLKTCIK